jgi:hypothetical protein
MPALRVACTRASLRTAAPATYASRSFSEQFQPRLPLLSTRPTLTNRLLWSSQSRSYHCLLRTKRLTPEERWAGEGTPGQVKILTEEIHANTTEVRGINARTHFFIFLAFSCLTGYMNISWDSAQKQNERLEKEAVKLEEEKTALRGERNGLERERWSLQSELDDLRWKVERVRNLV